MEENKEKTVKTPPANEIPKMKLSELYGDPNLIPDEEFEKSKKTQE